MEKHDFSPVVSAVVSHWQNCADHPFIFTARWNYLRPAKLKLQPSGTQIINSLIRWALLRHHRNLCWKGVNYLKLCWTYGLMATNLDSVWWQLIRRICWQTPQWMQTYECVHRNVASARSTKKYCGVQSTANCLFLLLKCLPCAMTSIDWPVHNVQSDEHLGKSRRFCWWNLSVCCFNPQVDPLCCSLSYILPPCLLVGSPTCLFVPNLRQVSMFPMFSCQLLT